MRVLALTAWLALMTGASAQTSSELFHQFEGLKVLGSVLYVAAHPDDENTRLIAYLANQKHYRTGYLSLTRGSGGQNLVGPELGDQLGLIRTQELLAARRIDGGEQFFTRARDFGYSKSPEETLQVWDREQVLEDMVTVIRRFQPDILITRFSTEPGFTHGHHTASAVLALEAFRAAAEGPRGWQPRRVFWNLSPWYFRRRGLAFSPEQALTETVSVYSPWLGRSVSELAAASRTMHKSQGFGSAPSREKQQEYFRLLSGSETASLMEGVETSWSRLPGGEKVATLLDQTEFDLVAPHRNVPRLLEIRGAIESLPDSAWKGQKQADLERLIAGCLGLRLRASAPNSTVAPTQKVEIEVGVSLQAPVEVRWQSHSLEPNQEKTFTVTKTAPAEPSHPHWLRGEGDPTVAEQLPMTYEVQLQVGDQSLTYEIPITFSEVDRVKGEVIQPVAITPAVSARVEPQLVVAPFGQTVPVQVTVQRQHGNPQPVQVELQLPQGWSGLPAARRIGPDQVAHFDLTPPSQTGVGELRVLIDGRPAYTTTLIDYPHIPRQVLHPPAGCRLTALELKKKGERIGYLEGAGDGVGQALASIGYKVEKIDPRSPADLSGYDAIVLGIRAYNVDSGADRLPLFDYVRQGGTLITQYNTTRGLRSETVAPFEVKLSRLRVTDEKAPVKLLQPDHPALTVPNAISEVDFQGWVQERGLYFPEQWDDQLVPLLESSDAGEEPLRGGLLVGRYGQGHFVYTGYSFFRQLPAGVPGAYRLLVNLVSLGHE